MVYGWTPWAGHPSCKQAHPNVSRALPLGQGAVPLGRGSQDCHVPMSESFLSWGGERQLTTGTTQACTLVTAVSWAFSRCSLPRVRHAHVLQMPSSSFRRHGTSAYVRGTL